MSDVDDALIHRKTLLTELRRAVSETQAAGRENRIRGKPLKPGSTRSDMAIATASREIGLLVAIEIVREMKPSLDAATVKALAASREREQRLREALSVYADEENWGCSSTYGFPNTWVRAGENGWDIARAILADAEGGRSGGQ